nr:immunoglobulin light chain junction region [Macaca mulatta]
DYYCYSGSDKTGLF